MLYFANTQLSDTGLEKLANLKRLQSLTLQYSVRVKGPGLNALAELKELRYLDLRNTQVTDAAVNELQKALPKLKIRR